MAMQLLTIVALTCLAAASVDATSPAEDETSLLQVDASLLGSHDSDEVTIFGEGPAAYLYDDAKDKKMMKMKDVDEDEDSDVEDEDDEALSAEEEQQLQQMMKEDEDMKKKLKSEHKEHATQKQEVSHKASVVAKGKMPRKAPAAPQQQLQQQGQEEQAQHQEQRSGQAPAVTCLSSFGHLSGEWYTGSNAINGKPFFVKEHHSDGTHTHVLMLYCGSEHINKWQVWAASLDQQSKRFVHKGCTNNAGMHGFSCRNNPFETSKGCYQSSNKKFYNWKLFEKQTWNNLFHPMRTPGECVSGAD